MGKFKHLEIGAIYNKNKVLEQLDNKHYLAECQGCFKSRKMWHYNVLRGNGCRNCSQSIGRPRTINGKQTKEYTAYSAMIARVTQEMSSWKKRYKGSIYEGMEIEQEWLAKDGYDKFYDHMGLAPQGTILDRIENDKGYIKGNLRWATASESNKNKRNAHMITSLGKTMNLVDWSKETGLSVECIARRLKVYKWPVEKALTTKVRG